MKVNVTKEWCEEMAKKEIGYEVGVGSLSADAGCSNAYSGFDAVSVGGDPMTVRALKQAYRKHVKGDEDIGWDELSNTLGNALAQIMGDDEFCQWLESI